MIDPYRCVALIQCLRWPHGPVCPHCGEGDAWQLDRRRGVPRWMCRSCQRQFCLLTGTAFQWSKRPLVVWFALIGHLEVGHSLSETYEAMAAHFGPALSRRSVRTMSRKIAASALCRAIGMCLDEADLVELGVVPAPGWEEGR